MSSLGHLFLKYIYESTGSAEPPCTQGILLSSADRLIFWIGGGLAFFLTTFLLVGAIISKRLREQPGDLIVGIAFSDFLLSIHWLTLATFYESVDDTTFCEIVGGLGTFAGINEFLYNVAFSLFMVVSLRNALKQSKIPKKSFHVVNLTIAAGYVGYLYSQGQIGKTIVGTCSIRQECSSNFLSYLGAVVVACYGIIGFFTYSYVKKNAPKCQRAHAKRTSFLLYYQRYVIACMAVYFLITITTVITTIASNELVSEGPITPQDGDDFRWTSSLYNLAKLCSPIVLSFVRLNDPKIKAVVKQGIFFWKKEIPISARPTIEIKIMNPLINVNGDDSSVNQSFERSRTFTDGGILLSTLNKDRKIELTYTLLSCVAIATKYQQGDSATPSLQVYERKFNNKFKHERVFMIDDAVISEALPDIGVELHRTKYTILSGTLKVYSPEVFKAFTDQDKEFLDILQSINFFMNKDEIREASGSDGGKSGEFFFFSRDQKLIIKTIPDEELEMLISILERYEAHFKQYPLSLIAKIYGAYTYENTDLGLKFNLIAMKNICGFNSKYVERKYDMKGSKYDREALKGMEVSEIILRKKVLKDSDFEKYEKKLCLGQDVSRDFLTQIELDSMFFRSVNLIDYSFMVYVVNKEQAKAEIDLSKDFTSKNWLASIQHSEKPGVYYNMGIIDYLQPYNFQKAFERFLKRLKKLDPNLDTSSQDPEYYSARFIQFMKRLVKQE